MVEDGSRTDHLLCGNLTLNDVMALEGLVHRADATMQALVQKPPKDAMARREFDMEVLQHRRAFMFADIVPRKANEWLEKVRRKATEHLHHVCCHPGCSLEK